MGKPYKIHAGAPLPDANEARREAKRRYRLDKMEVGDYVLVPHKTVASVGAYIGRLSKQHTGKFECRSVHMVPCDDDWALAKRGDPGAVHGVGVWRTA